jgi:pimeloyl-ACP methyl ester carboxylesterase
VDVPDVSYAESGDVAIAYQALGEGPPDLVMLPFLSNLYTLWQAPGFAEMGLRLAAGRRLIIVNLRGVGLSDRPRGFTIESRMDDLRAVLDALGIDRAALLGWAEAAATCAVFAAANPDRVERLVLYDPWVSTMVDERERDEALSRIRDERRVWGRRDVLEDMARELNPQWADDEDYLTWFVWHHRLTSSPASWAEFRRMQIDLDVSDVLPAIRVPTLVISKERMRERSAEVAARIADAEHVVVPGIGRAMQENEFSVEAVESFLEGTPTRRIPDTVLARSCSPISWDRPSAPRSSATKPGANCSPVTTRSFAASSRGFAASRSIPRATASSRPSTGLPGRFTPPTRSWTVSAPSA